MFFGVVLFKGGGQKPLGVVSAVTLECRGSLQSGEQVGRNKREGDLGVERSLNAGIVWVVVLTTAVSV